MERREAKVDKRTKHGNEDEQRTHLKKKRHNGEGFYKSKGMRCNEKRDRTRGNKMKGSGLPWV